MAMTVRPMQPADISAVISLGAATPEIQTGSSIPQFYDHQTLARWVKYPHSVLLVAEVDGQFAGFRIADYNPAARLGYLEMIAVIPAFRGLGVGKKLIEETLRRLKKMGCEEVWCIIKPTNRKAQRIYKLQGFSRGKTFVVYEKRL